MISTGGFLGVATHDVAVPIASLDIRNGIGDMLLRVIYGAFGVPYKLDTGFEATSALKQGFLANDGQTILEAMSTLYPLISGNEAKPLLVIGPVEVSSYTKALSGVPTVLSPDPTRPSGRGLKLVANLADEWGVTAADANSKTVWFRVNLPLPR